MRTKKVIFSLFVMLYALSSSAYDALIDGIYYNLSGSEATVTNKDNNYISYSDTVFIPSSVTYNGSTYSVTAIGSYAFRECKSLTSISIPSSVRAIFDHAFQYCEGLTELVIPEGVDSIGEYAFEGLKNLQSAKLPSSIKTFGRSIFSNSTGTVYVKCNIPDADWYYSCAFNGSKFSKVVIEDGVESIGKHAFQDCSSITTLTLPSTLKSIGEEAFYNCSGFADIYCYAGNAPETGNNAFENSSIATATLHVPPTAISTYGSTAPWSSASSIVAADDNGGGQGGEQGDEQYENVVLNGSIIGQWSIVSGTMTRYENDVIVSQENGDVTPPYDRIAFYDNGAVEFLEYSNSNNSYHEDGNGTYTIVNNKFVYGGGDWDSFIITAFDGSNTMEVYFQFSENKSSKIVRKVYRAKLQRVTDGGGQGGDDTGDNIIFADANVKALCVQNWDTNGDGELSKTEAAAVTSLGKVFYLSKISSFDELRYFTGLTAIEELAFYESDITSVIIPSGVTSIGKSAFIYCSDLASLTLPDKLTSIEAYAFFCCWSLTSLYIPRGLTSINSDAFRACNGISTIIVDSGNSVYDSRDNCNAIVRKSDNTIVYGCKNTVIPTTVTTIGVGAFSQTHGLTNVTIPDNVTLIDDYSYNACDSLHTVTIGSGIKEIKKWAFRSCKSLKDFCCNATTPPSTGSDVFDESPISSATLHVPEGSVNLYKSTAPWSGFGSIVAIGDEGGDDPEDDNCINGIYYSFSYGNAEVTYKDENYNTYTGDVVIPSTVKYKGDTYNVTSINSRAFRNCTGLTSVIIPESVTIIQSHTFEGCSNLTSVTLPENLWQIQSYAFCYCSSLASVTIPSNVNYIGGYAFSGCNITTITIPKSVTSISERCPFSGCSNLSSIKVDDGNTVFDSRNNCNAIIEIATNVLIAGCKNTIIPEEVTGVGEMAFYGCSGMTDLYCYAKNVPETTSNPFTSTLIASATLHVPASSVNLYKATAPWSGFGSIVAIGDEVEDPNPLLLGTWRYDFDTNSYILLTFSQDGTVRYKEYDKGGWQHDEIYSYSFNNNALKITDSNGNVKVVIEVLTLTSTTLKLNGWPDGGVSTFTKQNGSDIENVVLNGSIIGQWSIVSGSYTRYENDVQVSQEIGALTPPYDRIAFYDNGSVEFLEYSSSSNSYHEDGNGTYTIVNNKFVFGGGDWDSFIITAFDGSNNMEVYFQFSEDKGSTFVRKVYYANLQRVTDGGDDPMPSGEFLGAKRIFADNLLKSSTYDDKTFTYHYDSRGYVTQIDRIRTDGSGKTYTISYGDKITFNCSDGTKWVATLNSNGFVGSMVCYKANGSESDHAAFSYNADNQLTGVTYDDDEFLNITYSGGDITQCKFSRSSGYSESWTYSYGTSGQDMILNSGNVMEFDNIFGVDLDDYNLLYYIGALGKPTKHLPLAGLVSGNTITGTWTTDDAGRATKALFSDHTFTWNWDDNGGGQGDEQEYQTDNTLAFADNMKANAGTEFNLPIEMTNRDAISGIQFDLYLPEGIELCKDEYDDYLIEMSRTTARRHSIASRVMNDGALRVVISSTQNSTFTGDSGQLLSLVLLPNSTLEAGNYEVELKNIVLTDPDANRYAVADVKGYINVRTYTMGDVNNDGYIDVADLAGVVRFILENADASLVFNAADMDGNGVVEINDYAALVNVILNQGSPSYAPQRKAKSMRNTLVTLSDYIQNIHGEGELMVRIGSNGMQYTGMQFDLRLPEGIELMDDGAEAVSNQHETCMQKLANGKYRVVCASIMNDELPEGNVVRLKFRVVGDVDNIVEVMTDNIVLSDVNAIRYEASPASIIFNLDDATGIGNLNSILSESKGAIYDLSGRKFVNLSTRQLVNSLKKGIYIQNGKKTSIK